MLPGIRGSLIASAFLEQVLLKELQLAADARQGPDALVSLHRWWRRAIRLLGPASSPRAVLDVAVLPLIELLGYKLLHLEPHGAGFVGSIGRDDVPSAVLCTTTWGANAGDAWRDTVRASRMAKASWGLICSGHTLRLVDATRTWSRRALEFDLGLIVTDPRSATVFWSLTHCRTLSGTSDQTALDRILKRSDEHGAKVCASLGDGVLEALTQLLDAFHDGRRTRANRQEPADAFEQSLTIVYRLLFLLFAEARALVPTWHRIYRDAYTIDALCRRSTTRANPRGSWDALQAISRLAHAGCTAGDLRVTAFNGRLFSPRYTPLGERARVPDAVASGAVVALATRPGPHGRTRITYADLGVEQLGSVYERVLEYEPAHTDRGVALTRTSDERKTSGSFYTPRSMTEFLVRRALHPLTHNKSADEILSLRVVDPAMGSGAFLVAACRYLASAVERALIAEGDWRHDEDVRARRSAIRRAVAQRCLYGVDLNPTAVQLARLSLWLTTLAADRPLTFLDHHLATGNSLLGAGLEDLARRPSGTRRRPLAYRDDDLPLFTEGIAAQLAARVLPDRFRLAFEPGDTPDAVRGKERALAALGATGAPLTRWKAAADLWCAGWFWRNGTLAPGVYADVAAWLVNGESSLSERDRTSILERAADVTRERRFFHWELEFPEAFFDAEGRRSPDGGFDAVIGNPPWDTLRADTGTRSERDRRRQEHATELRFFRDAGLYRLQGLGHVNRYQLFLERALQLTRPGGRLGLILPSGLATDHGSAVLRRALLDATAIDRLIGFDNRRGIFPIHRDVRFLLLTATRSGYTERLSCSFGRTKVEWLDGLPDAAAHDPADARPIVISRSLLSECDPEHLRIPLLAGANDLGILANIVATVPPLGSERGWGIAFGRELNATDDRRHFVARAQTSARQVLDVIEGKHVEPFRLRRHTSALVVPISVARSLLDAARTFERRRLAYRDVASATNRLTLIAALLPPGTVSTHTLFCLKTRLGAASQYCLLALLNSLVANYLVRLQVTTHVTSALMARLPVPRLRAGEPVFRELVALARSLEKTGLENNPEAYVRLNTISAQLYGLTQEQYEHVVGTFPLLPESLRHTCVTDYVQATETQRHRDK